MLGPIERFDERDCLLARVDLEPGSKRYDAYYAIHQEFQPADDFLRSLPPLGSEASAPDRAAMAALFGSARLVGRPEEGASPAGGVPGAPPSPSRGPVDPERASVQVKALARYLGADLVGIGPLNPAFIYSRRGRTFYGQGWGEEIALNHPYAISLGVAMDYDLLRRHAPGFPTMLESGLAYARAASMALQLALFLRGLGYSARAHHLLDNQVLLTPVAVDGGLGELGRSGMLLTREFGSCLRLAVVTTDLPMTPDGPVDLGVQQFCAKCRLCARACPSGAIPAGAKMPVRGVRRWKLAAGRCYHYWRQVGSDCALCLLACPWSPPDNLTRPLRPSHPEPALGEETLESVRRLRSTLPPWLRRYLEDGPRGAAKSAHL